MMIRVVYPFEGTTALAASVDAPGSAAWSYLGSNPVVKGDASAPVRDEKNRSWTSCCRRRRSHCAPCSRRSRARVVRLLNSDAGMTTRGPSFVVMCAGESQEPCAAWRKGTNGLSADLSGPERGFQCASRVPSKGESTARLHSWVRRAIRTSRRAETGRSDRKKSIALSEDVPWLPYLHQRSARFPAAVIAAQRERERGHTRVHSDS